MQALLQQKNIILTETFPRFDDALGFWTIAPEASGPNGLDITGDTNNLPDSITDAEDNGLTATPTSPVAVFTWNPPLPPSGFTFQYRIVGGANDVVEKSISGSINHGDSIDGPEIVTKFAPETCTFHDADSDEMEGGNWKIDISEIFRMIELFNSNGFYQPASTPDGFAPADQAPELNSGFHDADSDPTEGNNWKIDISEIFRLIELFNNNSFYCCDPDPNSQDGYVPSNVVCE